MAKLARNFSHRRGASQIRMLCSADIFFFLSLFSCVCPHYFSTDDYYKGVNGIRRETKTHTMIVVYPNELIRKAFNYNDINNNGWGNRIYLPV